MGVVYSCKQVLLIVANVSQELCLNVGLDNYMYLLMPGFEGSIFS